MDISIKKREINNIKIKIVPFIINFSENYAFEIVKVKSEVGVSVSKELALSN